MNQTWEDSKKTNFGPILTRLAQIWAPNFFSSILSLLDITHCRKLPLYAV